ncbi:MAG: 2-iminoacetate synthase ThiH, partial [Sodaliphilus sp.]|nr:2-iminoacetate synthase ThiH [Sodaliphilus sp.]
GMKSNYEWRVNGFDRMGMAGVEKIGMGALIGLEDWRTDVTMLAYHLRYLEKTYWRTQYSVNFPRMRPSENGGFQPNVVMTDRELAQVTFAMRIFDHDVDISYSTRETAEMRNNMATLGVTTMSSESHTDPGGYACYPQALEQFHVADARTTPQVVADLKKMGVQPVWKNWDRSFDFGRINQNAQGK